MARLIDADVVLQRFIQESEYSGVNVVHINTIKRLLQDIDTAFDVEKVVEEIDRFEKEFGSTALSDFCKEKGRKGQCGNCTECIMNEMKRIVRKGGVNERL